VTLVKICGLRTQAEVAAAAVAGAAYVGFVFFAKSPRNLSLAEARPLAEGTPSGPRRVALTVDATDEFLAALTSEVPLDMLQLHGQEAPERVAEIRARFGLPLMKAVGIATEADLALLAEHAAVADQILVDARPPAGAEVPGGNGLAFDWRLLQGLRWTRPWMLAGGLTPENVAEAARLTGAGQVDVSSGVEAAPGRKDLDEIAAFIRAARGGADVEKEAAR
jgi:phosphoribosylanthranilate isomerase